jgi:hypothetical protein
MLVRPEPAQLWRWADCDYGWIPSLEGKLFLVVERFIHTNSFGDSSPAIRFMIDGRIDWRHEDDVLEFAEIINEAG